LLRDANQRDWVRLLDATLSSYNSHRSKSMRKTHFRWQLSSNHSPLLRLPLLNKGKNLRAHHMAKFLQERADDMQSYDDKATKKMKKWANKKQRPTTYQVGDKVMVKLLPQ